MATMASFQSHGSGSQTSAPYNLHSDQSPALDVSDFLWFDESMVECSMPQATARLSESLVSHMVAGADSSSHSSNSGGNSNSTRSREKETRTEGAFRIAFRTKSEVEIMDDGFKWRKYGKKSVKNSPNPRNYYRCSTEGCSVKKRVERDRDDPSYVITTYEGTHNHTSPGVVYYTTQDDTSGRFLVAGCSVLPSSS